MTALARRIRRLIPALAILGAMLLSTGCASLDQSDDEVAASRTGSAADDTGTANTKSVDGASNGGEAPDDQSDGDEAPDVGRPEDAGRSGDDAVEPSAANFAFEVEAPEALVAPIREQTFVGRWQRRSDYDPLQFDGLVARLEDEVQAILRSRGYFSGRVTVTPAKDKSAVSVSVRAGARTTVNRVELRLLREGEPDPELTAFARKAWALPEGSFFESSVWQAGKRRLLDSLNRRGFLRARITESQAQIDPGLTAAGLSLTVETGPLIQFGDLVLEGLERYNERVINDQKPFSTGDPYNFDKMLDFQSRLRLSGYFEQVVVVPDLQALASDPNALRVPLKVQLVEKSTKRLALGVGYSTDEGARGQIGLEHRDLLNRDWRLESALIVSQVRTRAFANVRTPFDRRNRFIGFGGRIEREDVEGQLSTRSNSYIGMGWRRPAGDTFVSLQFQTEALKLEPSATGPGLRDLRQALVLGYAWNRRRLDSSVEPREGYALSAQLSGAHESVASTQGFVRFYTKATRFFRGPSESSLRDGTLIASAELGWVNASSREDIPSENLFRAGGGQSVRGYRYLSLGVPERGAIVGGRYLALLSLEYQHRISDLWSLAVFVDAGNAVDDRSQFEPVGGAGLGVRFRTPVGPIHLDAAYGEAVNRWRLHFSVGYGF